MDDKTLDAYDGEANGFANEWEQQPAPEDMYAWLARYFSPGATADIGCGSGRDVAWLQSQGFDAVGYDASEGLLTQARARHPGLSFMQAALPELKGLPSGHFRNVLCETVIMHLEPGQIAPAVRRLLDLLQPDGVLYLSWRVTDGASQRDQHRRLYASFDPSLVRDACAGHAILHDKEEVNLSSGKRVHRLIVRKTA
jgi:SAM-dependent methyltransferase